MRLCFLASAVGPWQVVLVGIIVLCLVLAGIIRAGREDRD